MSILKSVVTTPSGQIFLAHLMKIKVEDVLLSTLGNVITLTVILTIISQPAETEAMTSCLSSRMAPALLLTSPA